MICARCSELDALLGSHPGREMMFDKAHLGHEIGGLQQFGLRVAAGDDNMEIGPAGSQRGNDAGHGQIIVTQGDIQFVEHEKPYSRVGHEGLGLSPSRRRRRHIPFAILRLPCKTLAHGVPGELIREAGKRLPFAGLPGALDELHDAAGPAVAKRAQQKPEGRRRIFAFGCFILYFISVLWSGDAIYLLYVQTCNLNNLYLASTGIALVNSLVGFGLLVLYSLGAISSGV